MPQRLVEQGATDTAFIYRIVSDDVDFTVVDEALRITKNLACRSRRVFNRLYNVYFRQVLPASRQLVGEGLDLVTQHPASLGTTLEAGISFRDIVTL